jgi:acyl-CoA synthetase (AMP-forming)/AMP-acid ligase II
MYRRFLSVARHNPGRIAITSERCQANYAQLREQAEALRPLLRSQCGGDGEGRRLVLMALPGGPHFTAIQLACFAENAVAVPIPDRSTEHEMRGHLGLVQPDLVVVESLEGSRQLIRALDRPVTLLSLQAGETDSGETKPHRVLAWDAVMSRPDSAELLPRLEANSLPDVTLIQFTSGSTGRPKGILLSRGNVMADLHNNQAYFSETSGEDVFCPVPQFHAFGWSVVLENLLNGSPVHVTNGFSPGEELARMEQYRCTGILAAPNYLKLLMKLNVLQPEVLPALRLVCVGTAAVDQKLVQDLRERFPYLNIHLRYGLTETMGTMTRLRIKAGEYLSHPGLVGTPVPGVELAGELTPPDAGEPAEVRVRGGVVAVGQLLERDCWQSLLDADGFFPTGDLGYLDNEGRLHLRGRISTFIKRNGFRINPFEIEALLRNLSGVQEAVAVGVPEPASGEQIVVCVETPVGAKAIDSRDLMRICRENLSAYKIPQRFIVVDRLPRNAAGKPDRVGIRSLAARHEPARQTAKQDAEVHRA